MFTCRVFLCFVLLYHAATTDLYTAPLGNGTLCTVIAPCAFDEAMRQVTNTSYVVHMSADSWASVSPLRVTCAPLVVRAVELRDATFRVMQSGTYVFEDFALVSSDQPTIEFDRLDSINVTVRNVTLDGFPRVSWPLLNIVKVTRHAHLSFTRVETKSSLASVTYMDGANVSIDVDDVEMRDADAASTQATDTLVDTSYDGHGLPESTNTRVSLRHVRIINSTLRAIATLYDGDLSLYDALFDAVHARYDILRVEQATHSSTPTRGIIELRDIVIRGHSVIQCFVNGNNAVSNFTVSNLTFEMGEVGELFAAIGVVPRLAGDYLYPARNASYIDIKSLHVRDVEIGGSILRISALENLLNASLRASIFERLRVHRIVAHEASTYGDIATPPCDIWNVPAEPHVLIEDVVVRELSDGACIYEALFLPRSSHRIAYRNVFIASLVNGSRVHTYAPTPDDENGGAYQGGWHWIDVENVTLRTLVGVRRAFIVDASQLNSSLSAPSCVGVRVASLSLENVSSLPAVSSDRRATMFDLHGDELTVFDARGVLAHDLNASIVVITSTRRVKLFVQRLRVTDAYLDNENSLFVVNGGVFDEHVCDKCAAINALNPSRIDVDVNDVEVTRVVRTRDGLLLGAVIGSEQRRAIKRDSCNGTSIDHRLNFNFSDVFFVANCVVRRGGIAFIEPADAASAVAIAATRVRDKSRDNDESSLSVTAYGATFASPPLCLESFDERSGGVLQTTLLGVPPGNFSLAFVTRDAFGNIVRRTPIINATLRSMSSTLRLVAPRYDVSASPQTGLLRFSTLELHGRANASTVLELVANDAFDGNNSYENGADFDGNVGYTDYSSIASARRTVVLLGDCHAGAYFHLNVDGFATCDRCERTSYSLHHGETCCACPHAQQCAETVVSSDSSSGHYVVRDDFYLFDAQRVAPCFWPPIHGSTQSSNAGNGTSTGAICLSTECTSSCNISHGCVTLCDAPRCASGYFSRLCSRCMCDDGVDDDGEDVATCYERSAHGCTPCPPHAVATVVVLVVFALLVLVRAWFDSYFASHRVFGALAFLTPILLMVPPFLLHWIPLSALVTALVVTLFKLIVTHVGSDSGGETEKSPNVASLLKIGVFYVQTSRALIRLPPLTFLSSPSRGLSFVDSSSESVVNFALPSLECFSAHLAPGTAGRLLLVMLSPLLWLTIAVSFVLLRSWGAHHRKRCATSSSISHSMETLPFDNGEEESDSLISLADFTYDVDVDDDNVFDSMAKDRSAYKSTLMDQCISTSHFVLTLVVFHVMSNVLSHFVYVTDEFTGGTYLIAYPWIDARKVDDASPSLSTMRTLGVIFYLIGYPLTTLALLCAKRRRIAANDERTKARYGALYANYRPECFYFDFVVISQRVLLSLVLAMPSSVRATAIVAVLFAVLIVHYVARPFASFTENRVNVVSLLVLLLWYSCQELSSASSSSLLSLYIRWSTVIVHGIALVVLLFSLLLHALKRLYTSCRSRQAVVDSCISGIAPLPRSSNSSLMTAFVSACASASG